MTSQLNVDTIVDKAGSGGTNVKVANNAVAVAEGGSATTTVVQGMLKSWNRAEQDTTRLDSFNLASNTDNGTGDFTFSFTNSMASTSYSIVSDANYASLSSFDNAEQATGSYNIRIFTRTDSLTNDDAKNTQMVAGDLA
jgi:hypothetical protein